MKQATMMLLLIGVVSAASAAPQLVSNDNQITPYSFAYGVNDPASGDVKEHKETVSTEGVTKGEYRWLQPNGLYRVTRYTADSTGYRATVSEEPGENSPTYYTNNLKQTSPDIFRSQGKQQSFSSAQTENQQDSDSPANYDSQSRTQDARLQFGNQGFNPFQSENQGSNTFQSRNQDSNTFQSTNQDFKTIQFRNQNSNKFQSRNQGFNSFQSSNQRFNNPQSGNRAFNNQKRNFQNQIQAFQSQSQSQSQSISGGQRFQNQGFRTSQSFQNQRNNNDGRIISRDNVDAGIIKTAFDRNFDSRFNRNDNLRSTTRNFDSNRNSFGSTRFTDKDINKGVAVVLSSNRNQFSN